jgi:hypothetical protein
MQTQVQANCPQLQGACATLRCDEIEFGLFFGELDSLN